MKQQILRAAVVLAGAEEMLSDHHENNWKRSYTLIKALNVNVPDAEPKYGLAIILR